MYDPAPLLAGVRDRPADDGPRLVYADWLEEQGEADRAEFIRVQCAIAAAPCGHDDAEMVRNQIDGNSGINCDCCTWKCRERDLLGPNFHKWANAGLRAFAFQPPPAETLPAGHIAAAFRRGFIDSLTLAWPDWAVHAAAILGARPVSRVALTTRPAVEWHRRRFGRARLAGVGEWTGEWAWVLTACGALDHLLSKYWPGVAFTVPGDEFPGLPPVRRGALVTIPAGWGAATVGPRGVYAHMLEFGTRRRPRPSG